LQLQIHAIIKPKAPVVDLSKSIVMPDRELTVVQQIVPDTPSDPADSVRVWTPYFDSMLMLLQEHEFKLEESQQVQSVTGIVKIDDDEPEFTIKRSKKTKPKRE